MLAAVCTWHDHHEHAQRGIHQRRASGARLVCVGPAWVEAYAVITRLPSPYRLHPRDAWNLLTENFGKRGPIVNLTGVETRRALGELAASGLGGGLTYDAMILACALKAKADELLTLNPRDFQRLSLSGITVVGLHPLTAS